MELQIARKEKNITQAELGELIGVQRAQISKLESNLSQAKLSTVLKVFSALDSKLEFQIKLSSGKEIRLKPVG